NWTSRWLVKLPKTVLTFEGNSALPISQVDYGYDETGLTSYPSLPANYDSTTPQQRGNATRVTSNTNAANPSQGVSLTTKTAYDVFGNPVETVDAIGTSTADPLDHVSRTEYSEAFKYAYPTRILS